MRNNSYLFYDIHAHRVCAKKAYNTHVIFLFYSVRMKPPKNDFFFPFILAFKVQKLLLIRFQSCYIFSIPSFCAIYYNTIRRFRATIELLPFVVALL